MSTSSRSTSRSAERLARARAQSPKSSGNRTRLVQLLEARLNQLKVAGPLDADPADPERETPQVQAVQAADDARLGQQAEAAPGREVQEADFDETDPPLDEPAGADADAGAGWPTLPREQSAGPWSIATAAVVERAAGPEALADPGGADVRRSASPLQFILKDKSRSSAIARYLGETVAGFCNDPAVCRSEGWQVSMPLNAKLLVGTTLHLSLSPHWCLLRFDTANDKSRALLSKEEASLRDLLEVSLQPRREVSISFQ